MVSMVPAFLGLGELPRQMRYKWMSFGPTAELGKFLLSNSIVEAMRKFPTDLESGVLAQAADPDFTIKICNTNKHDSTQDIKR